MQNPTLYILAGLPASGKSTMATALAKHTGSTYLRIDTVEQGLRDLLDTEIMYEGYQLSHRIAAENLLMGNSVVVDSCNTINLTRDDWQQVATSSKADYINIEIVCSDPTLHRHRVETRTSPVPNLALPTWQQVHEREYHDWIHERITVDTAHITPEESFARLLTLLQETDA
ncbi:AAA family ATPase [Zooshikella ganghwensis]|uniref:ATP-binding protein n=1 Tax=Zooshikella ganghwensis TaxID=202772 RepID=A0A4P9VGN3_9GAMM|nr:AAA family ATPase [Zooshikella ganghwensis]RDH41430.1 ATP-binding protein [Zooshikella ganghwensis]